MKRDFVWETSSLTLCPVCIVFIVAGVVSFPPPSHRFSQASSNCCLSHVESEIVSSWFETNDCNRSSDYRAWVRVLIGAFTTREATMLFKTIALKCILHINTLICVWERKLSPKCMLSREWMKNEKLNAPKPKEEGGEGEKNMENSHWTQYDAMTQI